MTQTCSTRRWGAAKYLVLEAGPTREGGGDWWKVSWIELRLDGVMTYPRVVSVGAESEVFVHPPFTLTRPR